MKVKVSFFVSMVIMFALLPVQANSGFELLEGTWRIRVDLDCDETHTFSTNGEVVVLSGKQKLKKGYLITEIENSDFYKFETVVLENNGEADCIGQLDSKVGDQLHLFMKFKDRKNEMHFYGWPNDDGYLDAYLELEK